MNESDLLRMRDSGDITGLLEALNDKNLDIRVFAAGRLGELGEERALDPIVALLKDAPAKPGICNALGQLAFQMKRRGFTPDPKAVTPLLALLDNPATREGAKFALSQFNDPRIAAALSIAADKESIEAQIAATKVDDPEQRRQATRQLAKAGALLQDPALRAQVVDTFIAILNLPPSNENGPCRYIAAEALGQMDDKRAVDPLISALKDPGWMIRSEAAVSLGQLKDTKAIPALESALNDPDDSTRTYAKRALQVIRRIN